MGEFRMPLSAEAYEEAGKLKKAIAQGDAINYDQAQTAINRQKFAESQGDDLEAIHDFAISENDRHKEYIENLKKGEYMKTLESYAVRWNMEKAARDVLQNFFDAEGQTLDGVNITVAPEGEDENQQYRIRVEGNHGYDFRKLLHFGGTGKEGDSTTAGGFGEGAKVLSLVLLRDYDFSDVKYGSKDWEMEFYLDEAPTGSYDSSARGLYARLKDRPEVEGSYTELVTRSREAAEAIVNARELFYSSENEDFAEPTFEILDKEGQRLGGFKYLGLSDKKYSPAPNGHFYDVGQRRHYNKTDTWDTVEGINIWTWVKTFGEDRDRGAIDRQEMQEKVIKPLVENIPTDQLFSILQKFEPSWPKLYPHEAIYKLISEIVDRMEKEGIVGEFDQKYLAEKPFMPQYMSKALSKKYILCSNIFGKIGMKKAEDKYREMQEHLKLEPSPEQSEKINLLFQAVDLLAAANPELPKERKEIWLFGKEAENSVIDGQYDENFAWMSQEMLEKPFEQALITYYHEICHSAGTDQSAEFSYALTDMSARILTAMMSNPEVYKEFNEVKNQWKTNTSVESDESVVMTSADSVVASDSEEPAIQDLNTLPATPEIDHGHEDSAPPAQPEKPRKRFGLFRRRTS